MIQLLRVTPSSFAGQAVLDWRIDVDCDARLREGRDGYGNVTHMLYVDRPVRSLAVSVAGRVLTEDRHGIVQGLPHDLPPEIFLRATPLTAAGPGHRRARRSWTQPGNGPTLERLHRLAGRLHETHALRHRGDRGRDHRRAGRSPRAMASARTSPTSSSPPRARPAFRPATSPAICSAATARIVQEAAPCLGRGLGRGSRLGRLRSAQRHQHRRRLCPRRLRARLSRRRAGRRRAIGWRRARN